MKCADCDSPPRTIKSKRCDSCTYRFKREGNKKHVNAYYATHRAEARERTLRYRATNRENVNAIQRRANHRRRASEGPGIAPGEWEEILNESGGLCAYCGASGPMTMDHVVPLSRGGSDERSNIVPACKPCNSSKGSKLLEEWTGRAAGLSSYDTLVS